jgi:hypothetical protein
MLSTSNRPIFANQGFARLCDNEVLQSYYLAGRQKGWIFSIPLYTIMTEPLLSLPGFGHVIAIPDNDFSQATARRTR